MSITRIFLLVLTFLLGIIYQPNWVYQNFWSRADFYDAIPFTVPFLAFALIYAVIATGCTELGIRFVKKHA